MFNSRDFDDDFHRHFESFWKTTETTPFGFGVDNTFPKPELDKHFYGMELVIFLVILFALVIAVAMLCRCCCRKSRGRVLAPPPVINTDGPAPYPQQQYNPATYPPPTVTVYPTHTPAPYPTAAPYPAGMPYPSVTPYPGGGGGGGGVTPYPAVTPYPPAAPYPHAATAPDPNACPPSYDQVMGGKQPPYNPNMPH